MHPDVLSPGVMTGLAWYYLLAAALNVAAALYIAYAELVSEGASVEGLRPRTRRLPEKLVVCVGVLYGLAVLMLIFREGIGAGASRIAYFLCAIANVVAVIWGASDAAHHSEVHAGGHGSEGEFTGPTLDDHLPAVGLGKPINRTLWTLIWTFCALLFQVMGLVYILNSTYLMPLLFRNALDAVSGPVTFFVASVSGFAALYYLRRYFSNGLVAWGLVNAGLLFFGLSMTDYDFRDIVTKPDNVPIVGMVVLVGFFTWLGMRRAVINDARMAAGLPALEELEPEKTLTWPDLVYTELICMVGLTILLVVWSIALQAPLEQPASSTTAPNPSKAPWYFLGLQEMLVYFDPWMAGVVLPTLIIVGLMAIPYIDTNKQGNGYYTINQRKFAWLTFQFGYLVLWIILILLGTFLRGPNWNFFGPYEYWDLHKLIPLNNVNLSDLFWIDWLKTAKPAPPTVGNILLRESPGILLCLLYLALTPFLMVPLFRKYIKQAGWVRYGVMVFLFLFMASLPIKMVLRWTLNLKYIVAIPEYFFNI